jgi:caffeoyl-CoA O-methyltransferase
MDRFEDPIADYAEEHSNPEPELLARLRRRTWQTQTHAHMLSDPLQGRLLAMFSKLIRPNLVLELGTFTGYSTLCLAEGLAPGGHIHTVDPDEELHTLQDDFWSEAGLTSQITRHTAEASVVLKNLDGLFDLVWIDADKQRTAEYTEWAVAHTRQGGLILIDNVLWWGKVLEGSNSSDPDARLLHGLNEKLAKDPRVENLILPLRDGIHVLRIR